MSRFNMPVSTANRTVNYAGGEAFTQDPKLELASLLLTSFLKDQHYRSGDETVERIRELIDQLPDKSFAAKAALYARTKYGMRSVSHVVAREIARVSGASWTARFFDKIVYRPDDLTEILSLYWATNNGKKTIPHAMKKGFAAALHRLDGYQLAKYRGQQKAVKLVDATNLFHPQATEALTALIEDRLKSTDTWESKLTQAGQMAETEDRVAELKSEAWAELIRTRKIGYFALLRNLRNLLEQCPEVIDEAVAMLTDERLISTSLVLPFRYTTAIDALMQAEGVDTLKVRQVIQAINRAVDISLKNVPHFPGRTLVALDTSSSMMGQPIKIGALFAAILYKANAADLMTFDESARCVNLNPSDSTLSLAGMIERGATGGGTNFHAIFHEATKAYDRIIILSDMQGWIGYDAPTASFEAYKRRTKANPHVFSFDLQGYGTLQLPQPQVYCLAGFSEKTLDLMKMLEEDRHALVRQIEAVEL